jgi:hypothetical protein
MKRHQFNKIPNTIMKRLLVRIKECGHLVTVERPVMLGKTIAKCV